MEDFVWTLNRSMYFFLGFNLNTCFPKIFKGLYYFPCPSSQKGEKFLSFSNKLGGTQENPFENLEVGCPQQLVSSLYVNNCQWAKSGWNCLCKRENINLQWEQAILLPMTQQRCLFLKAKCGTCRTELEWNYLERNPHIQGLTWWSKSTQHSVFSQ